MDYIAVGYNELIGDIGETVVCENCGESHPVETHDILHTVRCTDGHAYLVGLNGKRLCKQRSRRQNDGE